MHTLLILYGFVEIQGLAAQSCAPEMCLSAYGYCGTTDEYCGTGCLAGPCKIKATLNCNCPAGSCLSKYGFCGQGPAYCGDGCRCGACVQTQPPPSTAPPSSDPNSDGSALPTLDTFGPIIGQVSSANKCTILQTFNGSAPFDNFNVDYCADHVTVENGVADLTMDSTCGTRLSSKFTFLSGFAEARIQAGPTSGVVTAFITRSDTSKPADEIDWEIVGKSPTIAQTNFFYNSILNYTNSIGYQVSRSLAQGMHTYGIEFNSQYIRWWLDGVPQRTLQNNVDNFPSKPMRVELSIWDGTQTSGWAGIVDYTQGPFHVYVEHIKIDYFC